jgi:hypothetical protein
MAAVFSYFFVPETSGKALEEMDQVFKDNLGQEEMNIMRQVIHEWGAWVAEIDKFYEEIYLSRYYRLENFTWNSMNFEFQASNIFFYSNAETWYIKSMIVGWEFGVSEMRTIKQFVTTAGA